MNPKLAIAIVCLAIALCGCTTKLWHNIELYGVPWEVEE